MGAKIKPRHEILQDIITDAHKHPDGWKATFGQDREHLSTDCYISHPDIGIYLLKEYEKNPFERKGIGAKIARRIDDDITKKIQTHSGDFGIIHGNIQKILQNLNQGLSPQTILHAALRGTDLGIRIPVKGLASRETNIFNYLHDAFTIQQKHLEQQCEKIMADDGVYTSYS